MNFDFSDDLKQLREQARRFLREHSPPKAVRRMLEGAERHAAALWKEMAEMGWLGAAIPEQYGGAGLGYVGLCVLAEELGRALAPVPFSSSVYLASEAIPPAAARRRSGACCRGWRRARRSARLRSPKAPASPMPPSRAHAFRRPAQRQKWPVPDGDVADVAIVVARDEPARSRCSWPI